ncbi:Hsp20 family protein [Candidatus Phycosocius spiralis]|uniref:Heat-shock protein IbpA n=1 Tax=Candidatus Phycosocius spiralis TaxID=2815099 RepID=A0ABQ4PUD7_9PROT|nr:Hsp20 family protein [Candidatus Phycosocius spiralis]GIU66604.1 heat-shock protein IbpA [Candidatus Phycosocius spiralis]
MRTIDLTPLYRTIVGFDRMAHLIESGSRLDTATGWPPYNIEQTGDDAYQIELAVAGFGPDDLSIELKEGLLTITGKKLGSDESRNFLHRGIAERGFERRFQLADHVRVTGANLEHGMLSLELVREVPEALKPRKIAIQVGAANSSAGANDSPLIEAKSKAGRAA